jgi:hypothetical protein
MLPQGNFWKDEGCCNADWSKFQEFSRILRKSRKFQEFSRPGKYLPKFQEFSSFPGRVRTL